MKKFGIICMLIVFFSACKKNKETTPSSAPSEDLNTYLNQLQPVDHAPVINTPEVVGTPVASSTGSTFCKRTKYKLGPAYSEGFLLSPTNDIIYPGAILDGNSIYNGSYKLVSLPRTGGTISTDNVGAKVASKQIDETVKSKVQQGVLDILNEELSGSAGAQVNFEIKDIYSSQQVDMELGFTVGISEKNKIKGGFDFSKSSTKSRILVKFQQIYYTMTYDAKQKPADYFQAGVTSQQVLNSINGTSIVPVYVSNVKYGRMAFYSFESEMSQKDLKASLNVQLSKVSVSAELDASYKQELKDNNTSIKGTIIGGSGNDAVQAVNGIDDFFNYITKGGEYTLGSPGLPIAFTLRSITDNAIFNVVNISEYTVNECYNTVGAIRLNAGKHISGVQEDNIKCTVKAILRYDYEDAPTSAPSTIWTGGPVKLPTDGTVTPFSNTDEYKLMYDHAKFDNAYIMLYVDLINFAFHTGLGKRDGAGSVSSNISKTYKVYLKDIKGRQLGQDWSLNTNQSAITFDLNLDTPYNSDQISVCTATRNNGNCKESGYVTIKKETSTFYLNFSIDVTQE